MKVITCGVGFFCVFFVKAISSCEQQHLCVWVCAEIQLVRGKGVAHIEWFESAK